MVNTQTTQGHTHTFDETLSVQQHDSLTIIFEVCSGCKQRNVMATMPLK